MKLLLVEDDPMVGELLKTALSEAGYGVELCEDAECGELALKVQTFDAVVLDLGLPDKSGLDVLKSMRRAKSEVPVLILSARFTPPDRVLGLDLGADDYMVKPFDLDELLARLRSIIRRRQGRSGNVVHAGGLEFDPSRMRVTVDGNDVALQPKELKLLALLLKQKGKPASKTQIEEEIYEEGEDFESNTVEALIYSLRRKLGRELITTRRGLGYVIAE
ncbi:MAG: response regulator transcription factor [Rhodomicrobium sp.]